MPPPPASLSECDRSAASRDLSPRPGPSSLGLGSRSSPVAGTSCSVVVVVLPPLLRVQGMTSTLVRSFPATWIGTTPFGLYFASSGSSTVWGNWQV